MDFLERKKEKTYLSARIDVELKQWLQEVADDYNTTVTDVLIKVIRDKKEDLEEVKTKKLPTK